MPARSGVLLMSLVLAVPLARAADLWKRDWVEARSPNFVVISSLKEKPSRTLVQELEDFRQIVAIFTNVKALQPRVPTVLYVFPREAPEIGLVSPIAGFFEAKMRANYAVARADDGDLSHYIQHEYTHFLAHNQGQLAYPRWYDEGFAEVLGTVRLDNGQFTLGNASIGRYLVLRSMPWMKFSRLIDDDQTRRLTAQDGQLYYAQSWALVHYLTWGRPGSNVSADLGRYLSLRETGTAAVPAFESAFRVKVEELRGTIQDYIGTGKYSKGGLKRPFDPAQISIRPMPAAEVAAALGKLCIVTGHPAEARRYLDAALKMSPGDANALIDRGDLHKFAGEYPQAEQMYELGVAIEPGSDLHHLDYGEYWLDRAQAEQDATRRGELLKAARHELVLADKLNGKNPETLAIYGSSFLVQGEEPAKGLETLEFAHELLPSQPRIRLLLAHAYIATNQPEKARPLLVAVRIWDGGDEADEADRLLAQLGKGQTAASSPAPAP